MKKKIFLAALVVLTLIGCEKKQSEFTFDAEVKTAMITGKVTWPGGADAKMIAKDSAFVRAVVANAQYSAGASGNKQFTPVMTSQDGFYTIEIPVGQAGITDVFVEVVPFMGNYTDPNSKVSQTVYYTSGLVPVVAMPVILNPGDVKNVDLQVKPEQTFKDYTSTVKINGKIMVNQGVQEIAGGYENATVPYVGKVSIKGEYDLDGDAIITDDEVFDFEDLNLTAEANGEYSFEVPAGTNAVNIKMTTKRFYGTFAELKEGKLEADSVYYKAETFTINGVDKDQVEMSNQNFVVNASGNNYDKAAVDESKEYTIKKIEFKVFSWGEVFDEDKSDYIIDSVFNAFDVQVTFTSAAYDAANATSPLAGRKLTYNVKVPTKDGKVVMNNVKLYTEWEDYAIDVNVYVPDTKANFTHHYTVLAGFRPTEFKKKTWAQWHEDDTDLSSPLAKAFWSKCWPKESEDELQTLSGHYPETEANFTMSKASLYYSEYKYSAPIFVKFQFRGSDFNAIKGIWTSTKNDYDAETDSYPKLKAKEDAVDADDKTWADLYIYETHEARQQNKYQTNCEADLKNSSKFSSL